MAEGRIVDWSEMRDLTEDERKRVKRVNCGSDCEYCGYEEPKTGIAVVTQLDYFGDVYPEATTIILHHDEWLVQALDPDSDFGTKVVATYPRDKVVAFRNLPCELRLYSHHVLMPEAEPTPHLIIDGSAGGVPVPATDAELAGHLANTPHSNSEVS